MRSLTILAFILGVHFAISDDHTGWSYEGPTGPQHWPNLDLGTDNQCGLTAQSPIDINVFNARYDPFLKQLVFKDSNLPATNVTLVNNGYTLQLNSPDWKQRLTGGPLDASYKLLQIHCHWGKINNRGSEHTIGGKRYAVESHMVHIKESSIIPRGGNQIAVVATFFEVTRNESTDGIRAYAEAVKKNMKTGETVDVNVALSPSMFLPKSLVYYTYEGSLTTPPCTQNVTWIVLKSPARISISDLDRIRSARYEDGSNMVDNYRPTQPLNNREVRTSLASASPAFMMSSVPLAILSSMLTTRWETSSTR